MSRLEDATARILDRLAAHGVPMAVVGGLAVSARTEGLPAPIATVGALIALKLLARDDTHRPQDRVDLVALRAVATRADLDEARRLAGLIDRRGYGRGRDLGAALSMLEGRSGG